MDVLKHVDIMRYVEDTSQPANLPAQTEHMPSNVIQTCFLCYPGYGPPYISYRGRLVLALFWIIYCNFIRYICMVGMKYVPRS